MGRGGQRINVWPAKDMVLVFTGAGFEPGDLAKFILQALKSDKALPANLKATRELRERIVAAALTALGLPHCVTELCGRGKWLREKALIAAIVRKRTGVRNAWVAERLGMGHESSVTRAVRQTANDAEMQAKQQEVEGTLEAALVFDPHQSGAAAVKATVTT